MRRSWVGCLVVLAAALGVAVGLVYRALAADAPLAGIWKVVLLGGPEQHTWCLLKIQDRDGQLQAHVIWTAQNFKKSTVEDFTADNRSVRFTLKTADNKLPVVAYLPEKPDAPAREHPTGRAGKDRPTVLLGSLAAGSVYMPVQLERTDRQELSRKEASKPNPGFDELNELSGVEDIKQRDAGYRKIGDKYKGQPAALDAAQELVGLRLNSDAPADKLREAAQRYREAAAPFGREMEVQALAQFVAALVILKKPEAFEQARKAEELLRNTDPPGLQVLVLRPLAQALRRAGKTDEAHEVNARLARVNEALDREYQARAVPFKPEPFTGHKSDRTVLVELFTGAQCPPCVAADIAFDAALQTYKPQEVALLQYHLHIPGPDPMANPDTQARADYYGDAVAGTPTVMVDGKVPDEPIGGPAGLGRNAYTALRTIVEKDLQAGAGASLKVLVQRKGNRLTLEAHVDGLKKTGDSVRLRFALVEDSVRYPGGNGRRFHHHVVRALPGGIRGFALKEKSSRHTASVSLDQLSKQLEDYLRKYTPRRSEQHPFADEDDLPLELKHLKVVAFIQDDDSKEVLQASQADVPEAQ